MLNGALPSFDLADGGVALALLRALVVLALFSATGTIFFRVLAAPDALGRMPAEIAARVEIMLRRLVRISLAVHLAALLAWLVAEAGLLADAESVGAAFAALPVVLERTEFGHLMLLQASAAVIVAALYGGGRRRLQVAAGAAAVATLLQAGHSHALAMYGGASLLLLSDGVHLLAAAAWLGGLVPLLLLVRLTPPRAGAMAARRFSPLGKVCVVGLAASAAYQGWALLGGLAGIVGTAYGWTALVKLLLLAVLLGFACANRYRFAPALLGADGEGAKRPLVASIAVQTGFGVAVVTAAAILSSLPPGAHTQPVWPFTAQPSLAAIQEDADFRREAVGAVLALAGAVLVLAAGVALRRIRWLAVALALVIAWFAVPHLGVLLAEAYPTSFYRSTTGFAAASIVAGDRLYPENCAACHGAEGRGDGPMAASLKVPPADLTAGHLWGHSDGELFWRLTHGIDAPEGGDLVMPSFAAVLTEEQRWNLIDFIRARNAGDAFAQTGNWPAAVAVPGLSATCADGRTIELAALRGKVIRVAFDAPGAAALPPVPAADGIAVVTIVVPAAGETGAATPGCVAHDPAVPAAFSAVSGVKIEDLAGTQFLVDPDGWLRAMQRPGEQVAAGWDDPVALMAEIQQICRHPLANAGGADAHHHPEP